MENIDTQSVAGKIAEGQEQDVDWKRSIPAQIFLNYFFSLHYLIRQSDEAFDLNKITFFSDSHINIPAGELERIKKHLVNAWNTEYALRATGQLGDAAYLRNALHWTFPQAYFSVFESLQAFLRLHEVESRYPDQIQREAGQFIARGAYPEAISFYATGHPQHPYLHGLSYGHYKPSLQLTDLQTEAEAQVGQFLRTTRKAKARQIRQQVQSNPATAIRSQSTGKILQRFTDEHWKQMNWRIGITSIFSFLLRLRISANHREISRFVEADIDFNLFHDSLQYLVGYLNFVHEAYVAKAMGLRNYRNFVASLPPYLQNSFVQQRMQDRIGPLLEKQEVA